MNYKSTAISQLIKKNFLKYLAKTKFYCFNYKLNGGALYISILVSIVIGIILSLFILIANYNQKQIIQFTQSTQLYLNLESASEIALSDYFAESQNNQWIKNTFNDDSLKIKKLNWGAYTVIAAETKNRHHRISKSGFYGTYIPADTGLYVSESLQPISLCGSVVFKSNCYFPKSGIRPASLEGQSYIGTSNNLNFVKTSTKKIPPIDKSILEKINQQVHQPNFLIDSIVSNIPDVYDRTFESKTVVWQTNKTKLTNVSLRNNIKIIANNIEIDSSCHLENVLIICSKVKFKEGFIGKVHIIAADTIIADKNCEFAYPSSLILLPKETKFSALKYIEINEGCIFYGGILAINQTNVLKTPKVFVKLNAKCEINGLIYSSNFLHLEGTLNASIMADKLLLKTPSAIYENYILTSEINPKKYSNVLFVPSIFKKSGRLTCCQAVN